MRITIDGAGRIVVPKKIREAAQLEAGAELEVRLEDNVIQLELMSPSIQLKKRGRLMVAIPEGPKSVLTQRTVNATRDGRRPSLRHGGSRRA